MASKKPDRRVRKTKSLLLQGLIQLMKEKDIKDISVKELADLVDLNRGTFYLHYKDIYDMLSQIEDEIFLEFNQILDSGLHSPSQGAQTMLLNIFTFLTKYWDLAKVMLGPHGDLAFVNRLKKLVAERMQNVFQHDNPSVIFDCQEAYIISGVIGVIQYWLGSANPLPAEAMAEICGKILENGIRYDI